jgi:SHS2 domain-containing protein
LRRTRLAREFSGLEIDACEPRAPQATMFQTFDHTADIGLRIEAATLEELFIDAARGLTSLVVENCDDVQPRLSETIQIAGTETDYLLFDWLNELLFRFETRGMLFREFEVRLDPNGLEATVAGEPLDRSRHQLAHEVKAITYHGLSVEKTDGGWRTELVLDI